MFLQAQYVFIHKAMMEVMESMSTFTKSSNYTPGYTSPGLYANRKQQQFVISIPAMWLGPIRMRDYISVTII